MSYILFFDVEIAMYSWCDHESLNVLEFTKCSQRACVVQSIARRVAILKIDAPPPTPAVAALLLELQRVSVASSMSLETSLALVVRWLEDCDRAEALDGDFNNMHVAGAALCVLLHRHSVPMPDAAEIDDSALRARLFLTPTPVVEFGIHAIQEFLCNAQAEFNAMYELTDEGYECCVDVTAVLLAVMARFGFWLAHDFIPETDDTSLIDVMQPDTVGWLHTRPDVARHVLDVIHTVLSAHRLIVAATPVPVPATMPDVHPVHLEASMDTWWELTTVADCPVGSITQYKNKYQFLFHSVTQVIYYHYPSYNRRTQQSFASIAAGTCVPLHILPLLMQIEPDIPLQYEHTCAGYRPASATQDFTWILFGHFVLLCDRKMNTYCARDFRHLAAFSRNNKQGT